MTVKGALLAGLLIAGCTPPWSRLTVPRPEPDGDLLVTLPLFHEHVLPNGLTVWLSAWPDAAVVAAAVALRGPAPASGVKGTALQLTYDLIADGTAHRNAMQWEESLARLGALWEQSRSGPGAVIGATVLPDRLPGLLEVLAEMVRAPLANEAAFESRRHERVRAEASDQEEPDSLGRKVMGQELVVPELDMTGADYAATTAVQLREAQAALFDPRSAAVVITGRFDERATLAAIEGFFGSWRATGKLGAAAPRPPQRRNHRVVLVPWPGLKQTHLLIGNRLPLLDASGEVALRAAMGHYLGFLNRFRSETGTSYGPRGDIQLDPEASLFLVTVTVDARMTRPALRDVLGGLKAMLAWYANARELGVARRGMSQSDAAASLGSAGHAWNAATYFVRGQERDRSARMARALPTLTAESIHRSVVDHFGYDDVSVVVVGDPAEAEAAAGALGIRLQVRSAKPVP